MNRKEFLATTFAAGLGLAFVPSLLNCSSSKIVSQQLFEPLNLRAGNLAKVVGNVDELRKTLN